MTREGAPSPDRLLAELAAYRGEIAAIEAQLDDDGRAVLRRLRITPRMNGGHLGRRDVDVYDDDAVIEALAALVAPVAAVAPRWIRAKPGQPWIDFRHPTRGRGCLDQDEVRALFESLDCYVYKARNGLDVGPTDPTVEEGCSSSIEIDTRHLDIIYDRTHPIGEALTALALLDSVCLRMGKGPDPIAPPTGPAWMQALDERHARQIAELLAGGRVDPARPLGDVVTELVEGGALYRLGSQRARAGGWVPGSNAPRSMATADNDPDEERMPAPGALDALLAELTGHRRRLFAMVQAGPVPIAPTRVGDRAMTAVELIDRAAWINAYALAAVGRPVVAISDGHLVLTDEIPPALIEARRAWVEPPAEAPKRSSTRSKRSSKRSSTRSKRSSKAASKRGSKGGTKTRRADAGFDLFAAMKALAAEGSVSGCMVKMPSGSRAAGFRWRPAPYAGPRSPLWRTVRVESYHLELFELRPAHEGYDRGQRYQIQHRVGDRVTSWPVLAGVDPLHALQRARAFIESCPGAGIAPPRGEQQLLDELAGRQFSPGRPAYAHIPTSVAGEDPVETRPRVGAGGSPHALPAPGVGPSLRVEQRFDLPDHPTTRDVAERPLHVTRRVRRALRLLARHRPDLSLGCIVRDRRLRVSRGINRVDHGRFEHWYVVGGTAAQTHQDPIGAIRDELGERPMGARGAPIALGCEPRLALPAPASSTPWSHGDGHRSTRAGAVLNRLRPELRLHSYNHPDWGTVRRTRWNCRTADGEHYTVSTSSPIRAVRMALWHTPALSSGEPIALGGRPEPTFVLVGCVKGKVGAREAVPVRDLYTGDLWARRRRYADARGLRWGVVSARLGVVPSWAEARPYEMRIGDVGDVEKWRRQALRSLARLAGRGAVVEVIAGQAYIDALGPAAALARYGITLLAPLEGLGIGQRKRRLGEQSDMLDAAAQPDRTTTAVAQLVAGRPGWCWWVEWGTEESRDLGRDVVAELAEHRPPIGALLYGMDDDAERMALAVLEPDGWWVPLRGAAAHHVAAADAPIGRWWPKGDVGLVDTCGPLDEACRWAARAEAHVAGVDDAPIEWDRLDPSWWRAQAEADPALAERLLADVEQSRAILGRLPSAGPAPAPAVVGPDAFAEAWSRRTELTVDRTWTVRQRKARQGRSKKLSLDDYVQARRGFAAVDGDPDNNAALTRYLAEQGRKVARQTVIRRRREFDALSSGALAELEADVIDSGLGAVAVMAGASSAIAGEGDGFLYWTGGKGRLLAELLAEMPAGQIDYCEPFLGGGALYLALAAEGRIRRAILSDADPDIVCLWQEIQRDPDAVFAHASAWPWAVDGYEAALVAIDELDGPARAGAVLRVNRQARNGLWRRRKRDGRLNMPPGARKGQDSLGLTLDDLRRVSKLLDMAEIRCADAEAVIDELGEGWVVYADPPYWPLSKTANFSGYDGRGFQAGDLVRTIAALRRFAQRGGLGVLSNASAAPVLRLVEAAGAELRWVSAYRSVSARADTRGATPEILARWTGATAGRRADAA